MASQLNPYLNFPGTAAQAMQFYAEVFGGTPHISTFGSMGASGPDAEKVMHGRLETPSGLTLMCSDAPGGSRPDVGNAISLSLSGEDEQELRGYWQALSSSGTVTMPLEKQAWGDEFGMCTDQFGVPWMVNIVAHG